MDQSSDPVLREPSHIEVEQQSHSTSGQTKVRQYLRNVDGIEALHRLDFDYDRLFDKQIKPISTIKNASTIDQRKCLLPLERQPSA